VFKTGRLLEQPALVWGKQGVDPPLGGVIRVVLEGAEWRRRRWPAGAYTHQPSEELPIANGCVSYIVTAWRQAGHAYCGLQHHREEGRARPLVTDRQTGRQADRETKREKSR